MSAGGGGSGTPGGGGAGEAEDVGFDVVVGIDFGTSATGAFYSERSAARSESGGESPTADAAGRAKIFHINLDPEAVRGADSPKVPSAILLGRTTAFGWTALERYEGARGRRDAGGAGRAWRGREAAARAGRAQRS